MPIRYEEKMFLKTGPKDKRTRLQTHTQIMNMIRKVNGPEKNSRTALVINRKRISSSGKFWYCVQTKSY